MSLASQFNARGLVLMQPPSVAAASASIDFALPATFDEYLVMVSNAMPVTDLSGLQLLTSSDGVSYDTSGYSHVANASISNSSSVSADVNEAGTSIPLTAASITNTSGASYGGASGLIHINRSNSYLLFRHIRYEFSWMSTQDRLNQFVGSATRKSGSAIASVRLRMSAGNMSLGVFKLFGVQKS